MRHKEHAALNDAVVKLRAFLDASADMHSTCATFDTRPGMGVEPFTYEQKRAVRIYLETWVASPLEAVVAALNGNRSFGVETTLDGYDPRNR